MNDQGNSVDGRGDAFDERGEHEKNSGRENPLPNRYGLARSLTLPLSLTSCALCVLAGCVGVIPDFPTHREIELSKKCVQANGNWRTGTNTEKEEYSTCDKLDSSDEAEVESKGLWLKRHYADADSYCKDLAAQGRDRYTSMAWAGVVLTTLGIGGTAFGTSFAAVNASKDNASAGETAGLAAAAAGSAMLAALGIYFLTRSNAGSAAAGTAGVALTNKDEDGE